MRLSLPNIFAALKPRRRWFQFSLGSLFVLLTALCVWLGVTVERVRKQRDAVAAIEELEGGVFYGYQVDNTGTFSATAKPPGPKWLRELIGEEYFVSVFYVSLNNTQVTDAGLEHLKGLTNLHGLWLKNTRVTDAGLVHLSGLTELQSLHPPRPPKNPGCTTGDGWCSEGSNPLHPGSKECFRQVTKHKGVGPGAQCCYDFKGNLMPTPPGAGTPDKVSPAVGEDAYGNCVYSGSSLWHHFWEDVIGPWF